MKVHILLPDKESTCFCGREYQTIMHNRIAIKESDARQAIMSQTIYPKLCRSCVRLYEHWKYKNLKKRKR